MIVTLALFAQIATSCGSTIDVATLAAVAQAESRFDSAAINDNTARRRYLGLSDAQATVIASRLVAAGHSVDLGLMQVNSANLRGLGLSVADAFDRCKNIGAGAKVLVEGYHPPVAGADAQPALYRTLSHYNTGSPQPGFYQRLRCQGAGVGRADCAGDPGYRRGDGGADRRQRTGSSRDAAGATELGCLRHGSRRTPAGQARAGG